MKVLFFSLSILSRWILAWAVSVVALQPELWEWVSSSSEDGHDAGSVPVVKET